MMAKGRRCSGGGAGAGRQGWRLPAGLYSVRRVGLAAYPVKGVGPALSNSSFFN
jgi:hypothetical protein